MAKFTMMEVEAILNRLAGEKAEKFQHEVLYPQMARAMRIPLPNSQAVRDALADPYYAFRAMLGYYAFAKRGNDRVEYSGFALQALDKVLRGDKANFSAFLASGNAPEQLWNAFVEVCQENQRKLNEQLNRGLIEGLAGYAARLYAEDDIGNIWMDIQQAIVQSGRVEPIYQQITEIKGIGPKVGALVLRDMVALYDLESRIEPGDYHYLQPVDTWIRRIGPLLSDEIDEKTADWVIAGKLAKLCRRNRVSGVRFNQGVQYLAIVELRDLERLKGYLLSLAQSTLRAGGTGGGSSRPVRQRGGTPCAALLQLATVGLYQLHRQSSELPPSCRFPPLREGNRERRAYSVPPARRGNLKEGVLVHSCYYSLRFRRGCAVWRRRLAQRLLRADGDHARLGAVDAGRHALARDQDAVFVHLAP
jgi:hypothetical protein